MSLRLALSGAGSRAGSTESGFCPEQSSSCITWPRLSWGMSVSDVACLDHGKDGVGTGQGQPLTRVTGWVFAILPPPIPPPHFQVIHATFVFCSYLSVFISSFIEM